MFKKLRKWKEEAEKKRRHNFLSGFSADQLRKIVIFYNLPCADWSQKRCLIKSIRESRLTYQQIWKPIILGITL